jgi:aryl-alcohol dehydrogenase-like predicted oxidoreductase
MANKRILGKSSLEVSPITFGGNVFGWTLNEQESFRILDTFTAGGFNFIDTADTYSKWAAGNKGGESETIIGNWLKRRGRRDDVIIATKLGGEMPPGKKGLKPAYVKQAVEASLKRLQTDYIDLYQSHYDDPETPVAETMQAFDQLITEGKVRFIGASNFSADRVKASNEAARSNGWAEYISLQPEYNLYDRQKFESEYAALVQEEQLGVINYYALASGFLSGKYRSEADLGKSKRGGGMKKYLNERGFRILAALDDLAKAHQATPARIALAWLLHKPLVTSPIASATNKEQVHELLLAADVYLSPQELQQLDQASSY